MPVIYASDGFIHDNRAHVAKYLDEKLNENPEYCIVDIGGGANPWYPRSKYIVDIAPQPDATREIICGDLHALSTWNKVRSVNPDFIICSHVLEDIRNPFFVMTEICQSSSAGYISMPTKHIEFSRQESIFYV